MIGSSLLLVVTTALTVGWLYVEVTDALGTADRDRSATGDEGTPEV